MLLKTALDNTPLILSSYNYDDQFNPSIYPKDDSDFGEKDKHTSPVIRNRLQMVNTFIKNGANVNLSNKKTVFLH